MAKPITVSITGNAGPLKKAVADAEGSLGKLGGSFKKLAAVTAVGVGAIAAGIGLAVKSAAEDQKAFELLNQALQANTDATQEQIKAIDDQIGKMSIQIGVADDQLRPAFANLARATGDVTKSQELLTLATDISAATGKDLESVSIALSKAYGGNVAGLQKLGIPLDENLVKTKDFDGAVLALSATFGGAAAIAANTFEGKMGRLKLISGELVEQVGSYLLPIFSNLADFFLTTLVPIITDLADKIGPFLAEAISHLTDFINEKLVPAFDKYLIPVVKTLSKFFTDNLVPAFTFFADLIKNYLVPIVMSIAIPIFEGLRKIFDIIVKKVDENRESFVKYGDLLKTFYGFIRDNVAPVLGTILVVAFNLVAKAIGPVIDVVFKLLDAFVEVGKFIISVAKTILKTIETMVNGIITGVNKAIEVLNKLPGVDIDPIGNVNISLPTISGPSTPSGSSFNAPPLADRIDDPPKTIGSPTLDIPAVTLPSGGGGKNDTFKTSPAQFTPATSAFKGLTTFGVAERIAAMESGRVSQASSVNITVNTVTADANLPNLIVESLQRYNLISGPVDVQIAA
jgi:phage-related protein